MEKHKIIQLRNWFQANLCLSWLFESIFGRPNYVTVTIFSPVERRRGRDVLGLHTVIYLVYGHKDKKVISNTVEHIQYFKPMKQHTSVNSIWQFTLYRTTNRIGVLFIEYREIIWLGKKWLLFTFLMNKWSYHYLHL